MTTLEEHIKLLREITITGKKELTEYILKCLIPDHYILKNGDAKNEMEGKLVDATGKRMTVEEFCKAIEAKP